MSHEHSIIHWVKDAKEDMAAADEMIRAYMPFIRKETAKFLKRPLVEENDDELSIAMIAFYEAILDYSIIRGSFLHFAALHIKSRLIDHTRKESRHRGIVSMDHPAWEEEDTPLRDKLADPDDPLHEGMMRDATRMEIEEFSASIRTFGIQLSDVADHCPQQQRTLEACRIALAYAKENPQIMDEFLRTKRLPLSLIAAGSGVERKTLERHRKYMVALLLAYTNGFEIIRGHLKCALLTGGKDK
ncbi:MAG: RNA polymerase subunit sigma [Clostridia bacterium]|nr:RNA polymerase subunit sigma [Clostridia bacterium]